jgi:S-disulfanyl-L-cysteine oxidoreductase SoxD
MSMLRALAVCSNMRGIVIRSSPRKRGPSPLPVRSSARNWIPAFAGMSGALAIGVLLTPGFSTTTAIAADTPHLGKPVSAADLKAWNITILPDGTGLPAGSGVAADGAKLFDTKGCSLCHGQGGKGGIANMLVGSPSLTAPGISANKTIANFWGQPTTLFDYIRRAMPWPTPRTLSDDEVYALCAYLFAENKLIPADEPMNAQTLPKVKMPNHDNFIIKFPNKI